MENKDMNDSQKSDKPRSGFELLYYALVVVFLAGVLFLIFGPSSMKSEKRFVGFLVYTTGLPLVISNFIVFCEKRNWITDGKKTDDKGKG